MDENLIKAGSMLLQVLNQNVNSERILQITGEFNELETLRYTGEMLKGKNQGKIRY